MLNYFTNWTAYTMQNPGKPAGAAVVLRGEKGSGKSILGHFLKCLWGNHGIHISNSKLLVGSFNGHLADVCFVFADEAFYSGDKQHENILKANVTEPTIQIERKGIDAVTQPNYLKIFMATNHKYAVPATRDERRFCVFDVSSHRIGDRKYFDDLLADCNSEDVQAAFLYAMLNTDLTGWHTGDIPDSVGLRAQRYHTMKAHQKWLADCLTAGTLETREYHPKVWEEVVPSQILYDRYIAWCDAARIGEYGRESQTTFGAYIGKIFERRRLGGDRATTYFFGTLAEATTRFEEYEKVKLSELMPTSTLSENT